MGVNYHGKKLNCIGSRIFFPSPVMPNFVKDYVILTTILIYCFEKSSRKRKKLKMNCKNDHWPVL